MPRGTTVLMPGDQVCVAMRIRLEPLIDRLFEPDPEPLELPLKLAGQAAVQRLGSLLAKSTSRDGLSIGALRIKAGADPEHFTVSCTDQPG